MKYTPINDFLLIEKKETKGLVVSGQDDDPKAIIHGIVDKDAYYPDNQHKLSGKEVIFIRGQARKIKLDGKEYFIIKRDKVLLYKES